MVPCTCYQLLQLGRGKNSASVIRRHKVFVPKIITNIKSAIIGQHRLIFASRTMLYRKLVYLCSIIKLNDGA